MLDLSIIIVSFNTINLLENCIESIVKKTRGVKYEIIVVDNASSDGSVDIIKKLQKKYPIRLIKNSKNLGFGRANNKGIKKASGRYVLLLNSDTKINDNLLCELLDWMDKHPEVGVTTSALKDKNGRLQGTGGYFPNLFRVFAWMFFLDDIPLIDTLIGPFHPYHSYSPFYKGSKLLKKEQEKDWVTGAFFLARNKVFDQVGNFDKDYFMYTEEVDLCYRIKKAGWQIWYLPRWSISHLFGASSIYEFPILSEYKGIKTFFDKHMPKWQFPVLRLFLKLGAVLRMILFGILKGKKEFGVYAKAYKIA